MKKVAFYTLGCKVNQYETNAMEQLFKDNGYTVVPFEEAADVYVINTCTVTNMSDRKSRQMLRRAKDTNPNSILCAVGCYAQVAKDELSKIKEIDIILGTNEKKNILKYIEEYENKLLLGVEEIMNGKEYVEWETTAYTNKARAEVKVQDGCDRYCTYCIIPYARGPVRSRSIENIYKEINNISKAGIKEVIITGIHISSYGKDFKDQNITLIDLLEKIHEIEGIQRIRLGSLEPRIVTEEFVLRIKKLNKICNHFHLSLQSGCDETLKRMNRKYSTTEFENGVNLLRREIPDVALTTDIIVGFPGETDDEFETTYNYLEHIEFSKMHIFKYSPRKGTVAAKMKDQIDGNIKEERSNRLIEMSNRNEKKFADNYIGKEIEVLFENEEEGHTTNYIQVRSCKKQKENNIEKVVPIKYENECLIVE